MRTFAQAREDARARVALVAETKLAAATRPYSSTIANTYQVKDFKRGALDVINIRSPYFWSGYLDQGRGPVSRKTKRVLVWSRNPKRDDPRLAGGYPFKRSQQVRLTSREMALWSRRNQIARDANRPEPMIVTEGPTDSFSGRHFSEKARPDIIRESRKAFHDELRTLALEHIQEIPSRTTLRLLL